MTGSAEPAPPREEPRRAATGRLPDFFLVGHSKSGTTALYEMLGRHPQIFVPAMKEPIFFAPELPRQTQRYRAPETLEEYAELFAAAGPEQVVGEGSASYLRSPNAARLIAQARPDARIVAVLREPASFLRSFHLQVVQAHYENERDLARALSLEAERRRGRHLPRRSLWPQELFYLEHVRYLEQLRRYEDAFGPQQMLVLIYDDFRAENDATIGRVLSLLGVEPSVQLGGVEANPTVATRSQRADDALHALSHGEGRVGGALRRAAAIVPQPLRRSALGTAQRRLVSVAAPEPDERVMRTLRRRFRPEVEALSDHLGRDLVALWGYDQAI